MPTQASEAILTELYSVLSADVALNAIVSGGVHNDIPEGEVFPVILIEAFMSDPWNTMGGPTVGVGQEDVVRVHLYSRYQGQSELMQVRQELARLLNWHEFTVSGYGSARFADGRFKAFRETFKKIETRRDLGEWKVLVH